MLERIFSIPELVRKLAFTLGLLCIYRIGFHIPLPGLNQEVVQSFMRQQEQGAFGQMLEYVALFTGGNLRRSTLFGLGIMPYISASIIFQLLVPVVPALEKLQKEGQAGYKKIQEYTRYATVALCLVQASMWMVFLHNQHLIYPSFAGSLKIMLMGVFGLTTGTLFLMWLGEQIDEYGIGNGISLLIMAGIVARLPVAIQRLIQSASLRVTSADSSEIGLIKIVFLIAAFVFVVAGSILICQAQRRIPIQQAKHTRGRRVYGGQRQYLPLRVNHGGVMPIIFASSLLILPNALFRRLADWRPGNSVLALLGKAFSYGDLVYNLAYVALIFFFAYFWTTVQFRPKDMSDQLRDYGHFIPGLRPGKRTADYLERVMERITYCGAGFLAVIAVIPQAVAAAMGIPFVIASFLGGTALLIMVAVALDLVQRIESNLIMRSYGGFLGEGGRIKGSRE
ncbi:MAG: preprotein translocase subunit SecY [Planctomycetales bacterium 4484_123]|nr:MAG: preprotein translocase subunit SecY [Planctomycetales bacterium 4484_123]